ncbi:comF family protein [Humidesulfovibrio mexicanus]|uniref:ComF family protein n=1 Tax=Humidesulfovibrio mexicanus TaxID=147047 RepID=A0A238Y844_9BACT|nr:ComF family protein [Humidesulfovibrio mexicanus]SNR67267.1 comF family protein [Humidesulfovibrio mexicanus]
MRESLAMRARGLWGGLLLAESRCAACGAVLSVPGDGLCPDCREELAPEAGACCLGCGEPLPVPSLGGALCARCLETPRAWGRALCYGRYQGRLKELIWAYKFEGRLGCGRLLQDFALRAYEAGVAGGAGRYDALAPVPLHPRRLLARGFNQSRELARRIAARHDLPIWDHALRRVRRTTPQMRLAREERTQNIRGAFAAGEWRVSGAALLVVDDIMTTGATLEECARILFAAGAKSVDVLAVARA